MQGKYVRPQRHLSLKLIKLNCFMSWSSYPLHTHNSFIKLLRNNTKRKRNDDKNDEKKLSGLHCFILEILEIKSRRDALKKV